MPWRYTDLPQGAYFFQDEADALIIEISCKLQLENHIKIYFSTSVSVEIFLKHLKSLSGLKVEHSSLMVQIRFPCKATLLHDILKALQKIESLPENLIANVVRTFNLDEVQRLLELKEILEKRVALLSAAITSVISAKEIDAQEMAAELLEGLPKESRAKLELENYRLETLLCYTPTERKLAKEREHGVTKIVHFEASARLSHAPSAPVRMPTVAPAAPAPIKLSDPISTTAKSEKGRTGDVDLSGGTFVTERSAEKKEEKRSGGPFKEKTKHLTESRLTVYEFMRLQNQENRRTRKQDQQRNLHRAPHRSSFD